MEKSVTNPAPNDKFLDSSKLTDYAKDTFNFDENDRNFSKPVQNSGKKRNCLLRAVSPFPIVFSKDFNCRHVKNQGLFRKGLNYSQPNSLLVLSNFSFSHSVFKRHRFVI